MESKSPRKAKRKPSEKVTKLVALPRKKSNFIENWIAGIYSFFGIETLDNEQFHQALKQGRKNFHRTRLINLNLVGARLDDINLSGVKLNKVNLSRASLMNAQLHQTKMVGANLDSANLKGANLSQANLTYAQASWADLRNTNLSNTILHNANLTGADLDKSQSILEAKTRFTKFDHARLPYGVFIVWKFFLRKQI